MDLPGQQFSAANAHTYLDHALNLNLHEPPGCQRLTGILATIGNIFVSLPIILYLYT